MLCDRLDSGDPILVEMVSDPYLNGLRSFEHVAVYSNVKHDPAVHYSTSAIRSRRFTTKVDLENLALPAIIPDTFPDNNVIENVLDQDNYEMRILARLNLINWKRFAVIPSRPLLAHTDIIIKSEYWNEQYGYPIVAHLLDNFSNTLTKD